MISPNYIREINRIRTELSDYIFTGDYFDDQGAKIVAEGSEEPNSPATGLAYKVHGNHDTGKRAIIVVNGSQESRVYNWSFPDRNVREVILYSPFEGVKTLKAGQPVEIKGEGLQILIEK